MDVLELKEDNINLFVDFQKDTVGLENDFSNRLAYKVFKKKMHLMLLNSEIIVLGAYNQTMDELMGLVQGGPDGYKNELHSELYSWAFKLLLFNPLHWISVKNQKLVWQKVKKKLFRKKQSEQVITIIKLSAILIAYNLCMFMKITVAKK